MNALSFCDLSNNFIFILAGEIKIIWIIKFKNLILKSLLISSFQFLILSNLQLGSKKYIDIFVRCMLSLFKWNIIANLRICYTKHIKYIKNVNRIYM